MHMIQECEVCGGNHPAYEGDTIESATVRAHPEARWCVICDSYVPTMPDKRGCRYCWCPTMTVLEKLQAT
jgi:hypothetical protein